MGAQRDSRRQDLAPAGGLILKREAMSKLRQHIPEISGDLPVEAEGDLAPWAIFTQLKSGGPHIYAGWLDAADTSMALHFACEHYGQDQACVNIWAIPKTALAGTGEVAEPTGDTGGTRTWQVFTQKIPGDLFFSAETVDATSSDDAFAAAREVHGEEPACHGVWVAPADEVASTPPGEVIWRFTDQNYRMARGYAKDVRDKWEKVRATRDIVEYEREDLKETF